MPLIRLSNIHFNYTDTERDVEAVCGVTLDVEQGEFLAITGASGSGKSTLLNIIGTLVKPASGAYVLNGQDVLSLSDPHLSNLRATQLGFVFQHFNLIDHLTVWENIRLGLQYRRDKLRNVDALINAALDRVGLGHRAMHLPGQLSGGQQQRCAIARAIAGNPSIILADEPTGNLDSKNATQILNILKDLNRQGATVLIVTHAASQADMAMRVIEMHDGRIHFISRNTR